VSGQVYQGNETMSMNFHKTIIFASLALCSVGSVFAGQTVVYKGTGSYVATKALMPLGSGGAAVHMSNKIIATIEPSEVGFMHGTCAGMGHISDVGDDSMQAYCTFEEKRGDIFDIKATGVKGKGSVDVIGGSGKWKGATGTGTFKRKYSEGDRGTYEYEFKITVP